MNGEQLKAAGMAAADENTDDWWRATCDQAIAAAAATGRPFQAFDLCEWYGLPEPRHPNQWGPRLSAAARAGVIRAAGWAESKRPSTRASALRMWVGVSPHKGPEMPPEQAQWTRSAMTEPEVACDEPRAPEERRPVRPNRTEGTPCA